MLDMMKRHEVQVLRRAGVTQEKVAELTGISVRAVRMIESEPPVVVPDDEAEREKRGIGRPSKGSPPAGARSGPRSGSGEREEHVSRFWSTSPSRTTSSPESVASGSRHFTPSKTASSCRTNTRSPRAPRRASRSKRLATRKVDVEESSVGFDRHRHPVLSGNPQNGPYGGGSVTVHYKGLIP